MISKYEQQKEAAFELAFELGLADYTDELESLMRPAIPLVGAAAPDDEIPPGASKIGGSPDVPADFAWPYWRNWPLSFVAQIRLEEFKAFDQENVLPEKGLLALFCIIRPPGPLDDAAYHGGLGMDERMHGSHRLFFFANTDALHRTTIPLPRERAEPWDDLDETVLDPAGEETVHQTRVYDSCRLTGVEPQLQTPQRDHFPAIQVLGAPEQRDIDEAEELDEWLWESCHRLGHQLLGYAHFHQADHQESAETYTFDKPEGTAGQGAADWRLLLQLTTDCNLNWGGDGSSYLWIRKQDLAASDFSRTYMTVQR